MKKIYTITIGFLLLVILIATQLVSYNYKTRTVHKPFCKYAMQCIENCSLTFKFLINDNHKKPCFACKRHFYNSYFIDEPIIKNGVSNTKKYRLLEGYDESNTNRKKIYEDSPIFQKIMQERELKRRVLEDSHTCKKSDRNLYNEDGTIKGSSSCDFD